MLNERCLLALALKAGAAALLAVRGGLAGSLAVEDHSSVAEAEGDGGDNDDGTLEDDEWDLVGDELAVVAVAKLDDTVDASDQDEDGGAGQAGKEGVDAPAETSEATGHEVANHVVTKGADESDEDNDLEDEAGHGNIDTDIVALVGVARHGTAGGLQDEADDVGGDEDPVEELGPESGQLGGEVNDGLGKRDVDGGSEEDGCDGQADYIVVSQPLEEGLTDLDHEVAEVEGVVILQDTANIANDLGNAAQDHAGHVAPALPSPAEVGMDNANDAKRGGEGDIDRQRGPVLEDAELDAASLEGAVGVVADGDEAVGRLRGRHCVEEGEGGCC
ncbi:Boty-Like Retrotransposon [Paramyrothecium foliicola]|nr:Boty-Like Retrotransposon [Paramyrothecium foliicola]